MCPGVERDGRPDQLGERAAGAEPQLPGVGVAGVEHVAAHDRGRPVVVTAGDDAAERARPAGRVGPGLDAEGGWVEGGAIGHLDVLVVAVQEHAGVGVACQGARLAEGRRSLVRTGMAVAGLVGGRRRAARLTHPPVPRRGIRQHRRAIPGGRVLGVGRGERCGLVGRDVVTRCTTVGPGREGVRRPAEALLGGCAERVLGAQDDALGERRNPGEAVIGECEPSRNRLEGQVDRLRLDVDDLRVRQAGGVRHGQLDLDVRRVVVVDGAERSARNAGERL